MLNTWTDQTVYETKKVYKIKIKHLMSENLSFNLFLLHFLKQFWEILD